MPAVGPCHLVCSAPAEHLHLSYTRPTPAQGTLREVARAWLRPGEGKIEVNGVPASEYFATTTGGFKAAKPFAVTATSGQFDVLCKVKGGGTTGQAEAVSLAISRAIQHYDPPKRVALKVYK